jgi:hypothetical protein
MAKKRMNKEGLNTIKYSLIEFVKYKLYTQILIQYDQKQISKNKC